MDTESVTNTIIVAFLLSVFIASIITAFILTISVFNGSISSSKLKDEAFIEGYCKTVEIPSSEEVINFCIAKGYDSGWLYQRCNRNEVMCHKSIGNADYYDCVDWS
jgi:hypothetical protein